MSEDKVPPMVYGFTTSGNKVHVWEYDERFGEGLSTWDYPKEIFAKLNIADDNISSTCYRLLALMLKEFDK